MDRKEFRKRVEENVLVLDGSMGVFLQQKGMPLSVCPEAWILENPSAATDVMKAYIQAGSDIIYAPTFGGNRDKLNEYGLGDQVYDINVKLVNLAKETAKGRALVAGDITITGQLYEPFGMLPIDKAIDTYKEQINALVDGGADLLVIETMMDIQETRAAVIAAREVCDLPVMVSMTFEANGRTMYGTDPASAIIILQNLGADAVGCNCSAGPDTMIDIIRTMKPYAKVPLIAKPNAGVPKLIDGKTTFDMDSATFAMYMTDIVKAGASLIGGCCGTTPEYIEKLSEIREEAVAPIIGSTQGTTISSGREVHTFSKTSPLTIIGERINPTGKKKLQEAIKKGDYYEIITLAQEQINAGAKVLDVNVGMGGIVEADVMVEAIKNLGSSVRVPLCIDSSDAMAVERALRMYPGRALLNSISFEKEKIEKFLPIAAKYGAAVVLLPLSDEGLPKNSEERKTLTEQIFKHLQAAGYQKEDIIVDGLTMTVSANQQNAVETLTFINWVSNEFGCNTTVGLSNISFGLPERGRINASFLSLAMANGLTSAIANPSDERLMSAKHAGDVLLNKDKNMQMYIDTYSDRTVTQKKTNIETQSAVEALFDAVLYGQEDEAYDIAKKAYEEVGDAGKLMNEYMIPAITKAGDLYEQNQFFLPELIKSAGAMNKGFEYIKPLLEKEGAAKQGEKIILATVKGDIHDIGKNIVKLMLENHGFDVVDLGKDVSEEQIVEAIEESGAKVVGLSALMTTTMVQMKTVIDVIKNAGHDTVKVMVGGAVVTQEYADEIGADGYSQDANAAVKLAKLLCK